MELKPVTLEHGERYGRLTVLAKVKVPGRGPAYRCACDCGFQKFYARASHLMRGKVKSCVRCRDAQTF